MEKGLRLGHSCYYCSPLLNAIKKFILWTFAVVLVLQATTIHGAKTEPAPWPTDKAMAWQVKKGWLVGCNFTPSTAINQLEMWQAETFDTDTIDRELQWAQELGFNSIRVFLHNIPWRQDSKGFLARIDKFLALADKHHIGVMFVLMDSCWDPFPQSGPQREPKPHLHNSGWVQCPGLLILKDPTRHDDLKAYIQGVIGHFRKDKRIHAWDIFNEPDNMNRPAYVKFEPSNKAEYSLMLIKKAFAWAREVNPTQPLTAAPWMGDWTSTDKLSEIDRFMFENSDIISFHNYGKLEEIKGRVASLQRYHRPILCTEYMARPAGSTFETILPYLKAAKVDAYNWGFVSGKTQTIYPWDSWEKAYAGEPPLWFHDIFLKNGTPYNTLEVELIRSLTGVRQ